MAEVRALPRTRFVDYLAAALWAAMAGLRLRQLADGNVLGSLLALQAFVVAWCLVRRRPAREQAGLAWQGLAWSSALLPFAFQPGGSQLLPIWMGEGLGGLGAALAIWALASLGPSFGVAPADRGLVTAGPYRWVRHPAYAGELVCAAAFALGHAGAWNLIVLLVLCACLVLRIREEERRMAGYPAYAGRVRWRLAPGAW